MKVAIVTTIPITFTRFLVPVATELARRGVHVEVWTGADAESGFSEMRSKVTFPMRHVPWRRKVGAWGNLLAIFRLRRYICSVDAIFVHTPIAAWLSRIAVLSLRKDRRPGVVYMAHGLHFYAGQGFLQRLVYSAMEWLLRSATDALIVINDEDRRAAARLRLARSIQLVEGGVGVALDEFPWNSTAHLSPADCVDVEQHRGTLLFVGELIPRKRVAWILEALAGGGLKGWVAVIVGDGPCRPQLEELASELGISDRVRFAGFVENMHEHYRCADVFAFPSRQEGLSRAVMEAVATGLPVVGTPTRGVEDVVARGGGLVASSATQASFAQTLARVCGSVELRAALRAEAADVRTRFSDEVAAQELADVVLRCSGWKRNG